MNKEEFIKAVDFVAKEKGISKDIIFEAMELALLTAYKKNFDSKTNALDSTLLMSRMSLIKESR